MTRSLCRSRDVENGVDVGRASEHVDRQDGLRAWRDLALDQGDVQVEGGSLDVHEHRNGILEQHAIGRRDEAEGRGDHLITRGRCRAPSTARWSAAVPLLVAVAKRAPTKAPNAASNSGSFGPRLRNGVRRTSTTAWMSDSEISGRLSGIAASPCRGAFCSVWADSGCR